MTYDLNHMVMQSVIRGHLGNEVEDSGDGDMESKTVTRLEFGGLRQVLQLAQVLDHVDNSRVGELEHQQKQKLVESPDILWLYCKHHGVLVEVFVERGSCLVDESL